jgi:arsenate reductase (thioredoxin)
MKKKLFICEGNVGRSQMAEGFWKHHFGEDSAMSAGIDDVGEKYGHQPRADIISVMHEKGIDISQQKIKQITQEMFNEVGSLVILCDPDLLPDFVKLSGLNIIFRQVADPFECSLEGVRSVRDQIEEIILELIQS